MITGYAENEEKYTSTLKVQLEPDRPPVIRIIAPKGRTTLAPGAVPTIQWECTDDFGLSKIAVEQLSPEAAAAIESGKAGEQTGKVEQEWPLANPPSIAKKWSSDTARPKVGQPVAFRVVAYDNFNLGVGQPHRSQSGVIIFESASAKDMADAAAKAGSETQATISRLVDMQSKNLARTRQLDGALKTSKTEQWTEVRDVQKEIRRITGALLGDPKRPLAALQPKVMPIYEEQMEQVIGVLNGIPNAEEANKSALSARAIAMEDWILRVLTAAAITDSQAGGIAWRATSINSSLLQPRRRPTSRAPTPPSPSCW